MHSATRRTVSFTLPWDDAPVDLSFVYEREKPAGRHGFLQVRDGRLVFEDGTVGRFWGTNFNSAANFPPHSHSEKVARRLAKFGVNIVRFHQMDGDWSTPNIFQFTRGPLLRDTRRLDPASLDCLDYLVHCLKREGIYVYMDLLTYRRFRAGDGVEAADKLGNAARPYSNFDPHLIELQKLFNEQLWTHVNPYTGLAYKDDPAVALCEIANENDLLTPSFMKDLLEPYRSRLEERFRAWCAARGLPAPASPVAFASGEPVVLAFLVELQKAYYAEMIVHMRRLGVRIPVTGTNWSPGGAPLLEAQMATDFTDSHTYWYDWTWRVPEKKFNNRSILGARDPMYRPLTTFRVLDKPFFVSEWDDPWPNEWRAESPLHMAAVACLQGWSGVAIHTYRYDCRENVDQIAAPITGDALAGVPYRGGVFDTFNDPAKFGLFYHAALMLRRGDVHESQAATEIALPALWHDAKSGPSQGMIAGGHITAANGAAETGKVGIRLPGRPARAARQVGMAEPIVPEDAAELRSDTGQLWRSTARRFGTIDTPRTKAAYGFLGAAGEIALKGLTIRASTDFAVIAVSSLSDADTAGSENLLITAVGRADNAGAEYNADHTVQFKLGHGPVEIEVIEAAIELETRVAGLKVSAVNPAGMIVGPVPETYKDGKLRFEIGGPYASMYYLVQKA